MVSLNQFVLSLVKQFIQADRSAALEQEMLWKKVTKHPRLLRNVDTKSFLDGWLDDKYLGIKNIEFSICVKPIKRSFWKRLGSSWRLLRGKIAIVDIGNAPFQMVSEADPEHAKIDITVEKVNRDQISVKYQPTQTQIRQMFEKDDYLRKFA